MTALTEEEKAELLRRCWAVYDRRPLRKGPGSHYEACLRLERIVVYSHTPGDEATNPADLLPMVGLMVRPGGTIFEQVAGQLPGWRTNKSHEGVRRALEVLRKHQILEDLAGIQ